jgi:pimeloyl-ACP methyl ester carboxylesterase
MQRRHLLLCSAASVAACSSPAPLKSLFKDQNFTQTFRPARPSDGFNFPYILQIPAIAGEATVPHLIVETNNTGPISSEFGPHLAPTSELARQGLGGRVSLALRAPLLMPVFPRDPSLYTHSLGRSTILSESRDLRRLDLQLLAMARDAKQELAELGYSIHPKLMLTGFSASAMFATRFAAIHPKEVAAVAAGGLNAFVILPVERLSGARLPYPLGVADLREVTGRAFDEQAWREVPQFLFMGAEDTNDAVDFDDSYSSDDRQLIHQLLASRMIPDRWLACERVYQSTRAPARFKTYEGLAHGTNGLVRRECASFLAEVAGRGHLK